MYAVIFFKGSKSYIFRVVTHVKRRPNHSMTSSDLMEPQILQCTMIPCSPCSAALLVGRICRFKINLSRSSYALPILVQNTSGSRSQSEFSGSHVCVCSDICTACAGTNVSLSSALNSDIFWISVPRLYGLERMCSICFAS